LRHPSSRSVNRCWVGGVREEARPFRH
jgi:hypothetical protein